MCAITDCNRNLLDMDSKKAWLLLLIVYCGFYCTPFYLKYVDTAGICVLPLWMNKVSIFLSIYLSKGMQAKYPLNTLKQYLEVKICFHRFSFNCETLAEGLMGMFAQVNLPEFGWRKWCRGKHPRLKRVKVG